MVAAIEALEKKLVEFGRVPFFSRIGCQHFVANQNSGTANFKSITRNA
jgi:hypothetical protein